VAAHKGIILEIHFKETAREAVNLINSERVYERFGCSCYLSRMF